MSTPLLVTKLYIPPPRPGSVARSHLIGRLNEGLFRKLTLISAPAGFGKTTLVSEWLAGRDQPAAWLSLDERDGDPSRFLMYLIAALQTVHPEIGVGMMRALELPQPPATTSILTELVNDISSLPADIVIVLDDYHMIDTRPVDEAIAFLLEHLPPQVHLIITTREDPQLQLARLRARGEMTELRAEDLRFTIDESAAFLNEAMGLKLSESEIASLDDHTEGWIAGLQLAAISMKGHKDASGFIQSFTGSHRFVMDYLIEEVLLQQPESVQTFLLHTSILSRLCGPLCDAVLLTPSGSAQATLEEIERANLFLVPLDNDRRWYRYHHLFADLLRQRLQQENILPTSAGAAEIPELHRRASIWYEQNGMVIEAFRHAAAANDVDRAERLIDSDGMPRHFRGAVTVILQWLESLPESVLNARPSLWWRYGSMQLIVGHTTGVEEKLRAAEDALTGASMNGATRNLIGRIASARSVLALTQYQPDIIVTQAHRALEYLDPENLSSRANVNWTVGFACLLQGDRIGAIRAYTESVRLSQASGDSFTTILATGGLGQALEANNQLQLAAETNRRALDLAGDQPLPILSGAHLGLANVSYEWNDLDAAGRHGQESLLLARQFEHVIDRFIVSEVFLARLKLARGDVHGAAAMLAQTTQTARQRNFLHRTPEIAAVQVLVLLRQGHLEAARNLALAHPLPLSQARAWLAMGDSSAALELLEPVVREAESRNWPDELLRGTVLQALAFQAGGDNEPAAHLLVKALMLAEPEALIRTFIDEGAPMARLLAEAARERFPDYTGRLLAAFDADAHFPHASARPPIGLLRSP